MMISPPLMPLPTIVVGLAGKDELHAGRQERTEALAGAAVEAEFHRAFGQALLTILVTDFAGHLGADRTVDVGDLVEKA